MKSIIICKQCKKEAELHAFGLCSECYHNDYGKKYPERVQLSQQTWYSKNRKEINRKRREYENTPERKKAKYEWWLKNKDRIKEKGRNWSIVADKRRYSGNRIKALERDRFKCRICKSEKKLHAHHLDRTGFQDIPTRLKSNNKLDNLITLCNKCHLKLHVTINFLNLLNVKNISLNEFLPSHIRRHTGEGYFQFPSDNP